MPSPEHFYQHRAETPITSPRMQVVITDLAAYYEVDVTQADVRLSFTRPEQTTQWLIANLDGQHIDVARCPVADDTFMIPDIDLLLAMTPNGWQMVKVLYTDAVWEAFAKAAAEKEHPPGDPATDFPFSAFTEYIAQLIEAEARLQQSNDAEALKRLLDSE